MHAADAIVAFEGLTRPPQPIVLVRASGTTAQSWAVHAVSWRGDGVERANASVWLAPSFFGSNLSVTAWQPGGGGAVSARLSASGGAGEYCCVPPPLRSRAGRYSEWLLLDVKADGR